MPVMSDSQAESTEAIKTHTETTKEERRESIIPDGFQGRLINRAEEWFHVDGNGEESK